MKKREANKEKKQTAILTAALSMFGEKGYAAAKIIDIARVAGVGKGTIYEYYRSKDDLFFAVFEWYVDGLARASMVDASCLGGDAADRMSALLSSVFKAFHKGIDNFSVFFEFWAAAGNPAMRDRYRSALLSMYDIFRGIIVGLVEEGKGSGVFRKDVNAFSMAAGLVGALDGMMLQAWMDREFDALSASEHFFDTLIIGMRKNEQA